MARAEFCEEGTSRPLRMPHLTSAFCSFMTFFLVMMMMAPGDRVLAGCQASAKLLTCRCSSILWAHHSSSGFSVNALFMGEETEAHRICHLPWVPQPVYIRVRYQVRLPDSKPSIPNHRGTPHLQRQDTVFWAVRRVDASLSR